MQFGKYGQVRKWNLQLGLYIIIYNHKLENEFNKYIRQNVAILITWLTSA